MLESAVAHVSSMQDEEEVEESAVLPALEPSSPSLIPVEDDGKDMKKIDLSSSPAPSPPPRKIESNNSNGPKPKIQKQISNESVDHGNLFDDVFEEEEAKEE